MTKEEALEKYAGCYQGQNPDNLMSLDEGKLLRVQLLKEGFDVAGLFANPVSGSGISVSLIPVEEMEKDGFPSDKTVNLLFLGSSEYHNARMVQKQLSGYGWWYWKLIGQWVLRSGGW